MFTAGSEEQKGKHPMVLPAFCSTQFFYEAGRRPRAGVLPQFSIIASRPRFSETGDSKGIGATRAMLKWPGTSTRQG